MIQALPQARELLVDRGYDSDHFRAELAERGIAACIPSIPSRKAPLRYDRTLYRQRHRIENTFGRLKDWRRIATRYDRCAIRSSRPSASQQSSASGCDTES